MAKRPMRRAAACLTLSKSAGYTGRSHPANPSPPQGFHVSFDNKSVLITGGTGSFGKRFAQRLLAEHKPARVVIYSRDELKQHEMRVAGFDHPALRYFIGDIRDAKRMARACHGVDIVVHAAALKQVPACEYNPIEAIETNVTGTRNVVDACIDAGVAKAIAISTDKAVSPANLYGATKLCAEKLFIQANAYSGADATTFACVRYGNVIGSRGSVIPLFKEQRPSGKVTLTDARMTRFWITLDQGVDLVLASLEKMQGGEVFIPKIPSTKITDLTQAIAPDCQVEEIGIRPGEKIHEMLISENEARHTVELDDTYVVLPIHSSWGRITVPGGKPMPEGSSYTSDVNDHWLTLDEIRQLAAEY